MKKNRVYIIGMIFFIILIGLDIYNFSHPIKSNSDKTIYKGKIYNINKQVEYNENSEYVDVYSLDVKTKKNGIININLSKDEASKYKKDDSINFYEEKGEFFITNEKANDSNYSVMWIILIIIEVIVVILLVLKMIKNKEIISKKIL